MNIRTAVAALLALTVVAGGPAFADKMHKHHHHMMGQHAVMPMHHRMMGHMAGGHKMMGHKMGDHKMMGHKKTM